MLYIVFVSYRLCVHVVFKSFKAALMFKGLKEHKLRASERVSLDYLTVVK